MAEITYVNMTRDDFCAKNSSAKSLKPLYKYMPLVYALDLLQNHHLWFANPEVWGDPYERRFLKANFHRNNNVTSFPWKGRVFCTCFTTTAASEAHWNRGNREDMNVQLHFNREEILNELKKLPQNMHVYIGKVEYMRTRDISKSDLSKIPFKNPKPTITNIDDYCARLLLLKRNAFLYEEEIRIMIVVESSEFYDSNGSYFLDWHGGQTTMIQKITLSPLMSEASNSKLRDFLGVHYNIPIVNSLLYTGSKVKRPLSW